MSADKLILWESPVGAKTGFLNMEVVEFRRTRAEDFHCMALSNSGQRLAAGTVDHMITLWDVPSNQVISSLPGHNKYVSYVATVIS